MAAFTRGCIVGVSVPTTMAELSSVTEVSGAKSIYSGPLRKHVCQPDARHLCKGTRTAATNSGEDRVREETSHHATSVIFVF